MPPSIEISIPTTTLSATSKPYTVYNCTVRLPLRSYNVPKRYSDFETLNSSLTDLAESPPPRPLPAKGWFARTVGNAELTETRRHDLEHYLRAISNDPDNRWRNTAAWRAFLNLPSSFASQTSSKAATNLQSIISGPAGGGAPITDPIVWLDCHRDLKTHLHDARLYLTNRDQAITPQQQHEASASAKSCLVKASGMISALEEGLKNIQKGGSGFGGQRLGDGEIRRRKDLIAASRKDRDGLEGLLNAMVQKSQLDSAVASIEEKKTLVGSGAAFKPKSGGRVLGKETSETRELDNNGVLQLQKQKMADQDLDVDDLRKIIQRQRELGVAINQELEVQNEMLKMVDEDVDRVQGKIDIAKKRIGKIS